MQVVTGTPIINSPKDLGALLHFLKICAPLDDLDYYNRALIRPLNKGDGRAAELLKVRSFQSNIVCTLRSSLCRVSVSRP